MNENQFTGHFSGLLNALEPLRRIQEMVNHSAVTPAWAEAFRQQFRPLEAIASQFSAAIPRELLDQMQHLEDYGQQLLQEMEQQPDASQQLQQLQSITAAIVQPTRTDATLETAQVALNQLVSVVQQHGELLEQLVAQGNDAGKTFREYLNLVIAALALLISYLALNQSPQQVAAPEIAPSVATAATTTVTATTATAADGILIVENEVMIADTMGRLVQGMGYTALESVFSGQEALDVLRTTRVDLVVTNVKLEGEMTGIELARQIRQEFGIPVLLVSAYSPQTLQAHVQAGVVQGYVSKPFTDHAFKKGVRDALGQPE